MSRWPQWIGYAAALWSLLYGALGLWWTFGGPGFPFGEVGDPLGARVSMLEHVLPDPGAQIVATLGILGALVSLALARGRRRNPLLILAAGYACVMAVT